MFQLQMGRNFEARSEGEVPSGRATLRGHPDVVRFRMDLQLPLPSLELKAWVATVLGKEHLFLTGLPR